MGLSFAGMLGIAGIEVQKKESILINYNIYIVYKD